MCLLARIEEVNGGDEVRLAHRLKVETVPQFRVVAALDWNGQAALKGNDGGNCPAVPHFADKALVLGNRQLPVRTEDEAMPRIERGEGPASPRVEEIDNTFKARGTVNRPAEGIGRLELQTVRHVLLHESLHRVIDRIADRILSENTSKDGDPVRRATDTRSRLTIGRAKRTQANYSNRVGIRPGHSGYTAVRQVQSDSRREPLSLLGIRPALQG